MRRSARVFVLAAWWCLAPPPAVAAEPPGGYFKDAAWGYKVKTPKGWRRAALSGDDAKWIACKFLGKRELEAIRIYAREAPQMWVVALPPRSRAKSADSEDAAGAYPYTDYPEFVRSHGDFLEWTRGNYAVTGEKETEVDGVPVTMYEIEGRPTKPPGESPRRVVCWVYHFDDEDFAVQFKILEGHYDRYRGAFRACLKSFKRIKRTEALPGGSGARSADETAKRGPLTPAERVKALRDEVRRALAREVESLLEGWQSRRSKNYLVLYNADPKFVVRTIAHAEAVRAHVEKLFGRIPGDYVPPDVLRIFGSDEGRRAYTAREGGIWDTLHEILIVYGHGYVKDSEYETLNRSILSGWFHRQDPALEKKLPHWLEIGLHKYMDMVRSKGKRIT
ncbi:MAG: hypothetical protein ACE5JG_06970, partial [Planctomycetota bacterium]